MFFVRPDQLRKPQGIAGLITGRFLNKRNFSRYLSLISILHPKAGETLYEIGFGPGRGIQEILKNYPVRIEGLDFSRLMYSQALRRNRKAVKEGLLRLSFGDFTDSEVKAEFYDAVFFSNVLYFWDDLKSCFKKIFSMLKPEGRLVFYMTEGKYFFTNKATNSDIFHKYSTEEVLEILKLCGFFDLSKTDLNPPGETFFVISCRKKSSKS